MPWKVNQTGISNSVIFTRDKEDPAIIGYLGCVYLQGFWVRKKEKELFFSFVWLRWEKENIFLFQFPSILNFLNQSHQ